MSFDRILAPLISCFTDDTLSVSEIRFARVARFHLEHGAAGFYVGGWSADFYTVSLSERKQLLEWAIRDAHGAPVYVNATSMTTTTSIDLCQHAARHGARGAVVMTPPIGKYTEEELGAFQRGIQRYGNLSTVFLSLDGVTVPPSSEGGPNLPVAEGLGGFSCGRGAMAEEVSTPDGVITPLALFGADVVPQILAGWEKFRPAFESMFLHGGLGRCARAAIVNAGLDVGPARGPIAPLNGEGQKILLTLARALGQASDG